MAITLLQGLNNQILPSLEPGSFTLIYMDPPFFTGRQFKDRSGEVQFVDNQWTSLEHFVASITHVLTLCRPLLTHQGNLVLHLDSRTSHYLKVAGDGIFGYSNFRSEIIWRYRRWPTKTPNFQRIHDTLLRWSFGPEPCFNQLYEVMSSKTLKQWGQDRQVASTTLTGNRISKRSGALSPGCPMGDCWHDIGIIAPMAHERTGYPTQKPLALLDRLIMSLTNPGDLVLDPYCGSGTTLVAAEQAGRSGVGIDLNPRALEIGSRRLGHTYQETYLGPDDE